MHGLCVEGHTLTDAQRLLVESALVYSGGTHTVDDVEAMLADKSAQLWEGPHSVIITEIDAQPQNRTLLFFLAAGVMDELKAMEPKICAWGAEKGCTKARFIGRKGWERSFLSRCGWTNTHVVVLEKAIHE